MEKKKKLVTIAASILVVLVLLTPVPIRWKDGGSVTFKALVYEVTKIHQLPPNLDAPYIEGFEVKILGMTVYRKTSG